MTTLQGIGQGQSALLALLIRGAGPRLERLLAGLDGGVYISGGRDGDFGVGVSGRGVNSMAGGCRGRQLAVDNVFERREVEFTGHD